ncbi:MAG: YihY/virulence factor BrkB family protein, partial [Myxococcaceae bacterium]
MARRLLHGLKDESTQVLLKAWEPVSHSRGGLFASDTLRALGAVLHGFIGERISLRAAAMTFVSIFSLVPILTVALGFMQWLHQDEFHERLRSFVRDVLAPGARPESSAVVEQFLTAASSAQAGSIGALMLLISAGMLLHNLDASLHEIWSVRRRRPLALSLSLYALVLTLGPLLLASSLVGSAVIRASLRELDLPYFGELMTGVATLAAVGVCTLLYKFAPNAPVRFRSAFAGGLVAGGAWQVARSV